MARRALHGHERRRTRLRTIPLREAARGRARTLKPRDRRAPRDDCVTPGATLDVATATCGASALEHRRCRDARATRGLAFARVRPARCPAVNGETGARATDDELGDRRPQALPISYAAARLHPAAALSGAFVERLGAWRPSRARVADGTEDVADRKPIGVCLHVDQSGLLKRIDEILPVVAADVTLARVRRAESRSSGRNADDQRAARSEVALPATQSFDLVTEMLENFESADHVEALIRLVVLFAHAQDVAARADLRTRRFEGRSIGLEADVSIRTREERPDSADACADLEDACRVGRQQPASCVVPKAAVDRHRRRSAHRAELAFVPIALS